MIARSLLAALVASGAVFLIAATTPPPAGPPAGSNALTATQMRALLPKTALHTAFIVSTNKLGQVTDAKAKTLSKNATFNVQTYGNALQMFIRTSPTTAISGLYTLTYDYDPKTHGIARAVALIHAGGVDPNAKGAALVMMDTARKEAAAAAAKAKHATPAPHAPATAHSR